MYKRQGVNVPNVGYGKLNCSFAKGGAKLLQSTLESNFQISIDNYIATDFVSMADIIDLFGGVDLDITDAEIPVINGYINEMATLRGFDPSEYQLSAAGTLHLNGLQAVGYMRDLSLIHIYTVDGGSVGEIEYENFNAANLRVEVQGYGIHPGSAKGKMRCV